MSKLHRVLPLYLFLFLIVPQIFSYTGDRYAGLSQETLYYLRQSYEELAQYFDSKGDNRRAEEMRARAKEVPVSKETLANPPADPSTLPEDLPEPKVTVKKKMSQTKSVAPLQRKNPIKAYSMQQVLQELKKPDASDAEVSANYLVNRYLLGLITGNLDAATAFFDEQVEYPGYNLSLSREELCNLYAELIAVYQMDNLSPADFYQLDIAPQIRQLDNNHIEYILYAQDKAPTVLQNSGFWSNFFGNVHVYVFTKKDGNWYLSALRTLPLE